MASNLVPDYEVKVPLKPSEVLGPNNKLKDTVLSAFFMPSSTKKMNIQFVDTTTQDIYTKGWSLRIRKAEGEDEFELTYKKRYDISEGASSTTGGNIDAALKTAQQQGFDSTTAFEAQVEVGYCKQTLSISYDVKVSDMGFKGMDLPLAEDARKFLTNKAPEEFKNWLADNWGTDQLAGSIVYGPVHAKRSKGTWNEFGLFIEVWMIQKSKTDTSLEPIVEASFKNPDLEKAMEGRDELVQFLQNRDRDWFLAEDSLKTKLIMERYGEITPDL
jgi:hypothetical protein